MKQSTTEDKDGDNSSDQNKEIRSLIQRGKPFFSNTCQSGLKQVLAMFLKLANKYQILYFTDDRSISFPPQHAGSLWLASTYSRMKLKKYGIHKKNLDKNDDFVYSIPLFCCSFFFLNKKTEIIDVLGVIFF